MDEMTPREKAEAIYNFEKGQDRMLIRGRFLTIIIGGIYILSSLTSFIFSDSYGFFNLIINLILIVALIFGIVWVRVLLGIFALISAAGWLYILLVKISGGPPVIYLLFWGVLILNLIIGSLLLFNKSIREYLYYRANN